MRRLLVALLVCTTVATYAGGRAGAAPAAKPTLGPSDRAAILVLIDRFVVLAIARKDPGAAYDLASSDLREGLTRAEWSTGNIPVYPFSPRGTHFPWTLDGIVEGRVSIELLLQPRDPKAGALAYNVEVKKIGGRWLVDQIQPVASFAPPTGKASVAGPKDYQAGSAPSTSGEGQLSLIWLGLAVGGFAAALLAVVAYVVVRNVRRRRRIESEFRRERELPPLPGAR